MPSLSSAPYVGAPWGANTNEATTSATIATAAVEPTTHHTILPRRRLASWRWYSASFSWRFCSRCCLTVWLMFAWVAGLPLARRSDGRDAGVMCGGFGFRGGGGRG